MTSRPIPVDAGLLARFREAGTKIAWRPAAARPGGGSARGQIAHLHDEEARVERWGSERRGGLAADSGPLGALVVLLEADRRGPPTAWGSWNAGTDARFRSGAIVASWGGPVARSDSAPQIADLVELARYALA